ncbi:MAG TPA: OmpH family outer membrane protein [Bacteroidetes bacterium]|nr:OmpH family outer membrane protein [Bacteroidota bacterium]
MKRLPVILLFTLFSAISYGQKFAYINTQEILANMPEVQQANSNIETFRNQLISLGQQKLEALQKKYKDLEGKQSRGELSPKQLDEEAKKLKLEEEQLTKFDQESQQKIMKKSEELLKPIRDKVQKAIDDVAKEDGYEFIFDASMGFILYADESTNIGDKVKAKLGIK